MKNIFKLVITISCLLGANSLFAKTIAQQVASNCDAATASKACTSAQEDKLAAGTLQCCKSKDANKEVAELKADTSVVVAQTATPTCGGDVDDGAKRATADLGVPAEGGTGTGTKQKP